MSRYKHTPAEERILAALATMPYGGLLRDVSRKVGFDHKFTSVPTPIALDDVGAYLEALGEVLQNAVRSDNARSARLRELEDGVAAIRRMFGIGAES